ncbi:MAG: hypothetical protein ACI8X5_001961 [Planctomycetota bacterium]|jgi:hypothetical protein
MRNTALSTACILALASTTFGQSLNELYISHTGTDTKEFVEILGTGSTSLDGFMFLVVEGDSSAAGTLDVAVDFTGMTLPADGYFVIGDTATANLDLDLGTSDTFENGSQTFYLISTTDVAAVNALVGLDIDADGDTITDLAGMASVTIVDLIGMGDGGVGSGDTFYDGATILGPDVTFFPAGIYCGDDVPGGWCSEFLDFNLAADRTPGAANGSCAGGPVIIGTPYCYGDGSGTACPCANTGGTGEGCANSTGSGAFLVASGSLSIAAADLVLTGTGAPSGVSGIFFAGTNQITGGNGNPFGDGLRCVGGPVTRIETIAADGSGTAFSTIDIGARVGATSGSTNTIQYWYRDIPGPCTIGFNFSHGLEVTWSL